LPNVPHLSKISQERLQRRAIFFGIEVQKLVRIANNNCCGTKLIDFRRDTLVKSAFVVLVVGEFVKWIIYIPHCN